MLQELVLISSIFTSILADKDSSSRKKKRKIKREIMKGNWLDMIYKES